jgi:methionyl-tRNA formyltransferase
MLPEIRGMSTPEWSLLKSVPIGVTIHFLDRGIDTGPVLQRFELPDAANCNSLSDLRHRLIAFGLEKVAEVITDLDRGVLAPTPQPALDRDNQHFVMHEWLQARAVEYLANSQQRATANPAHHTISHPNMVRPC